MSGKLRSKKKGKSIHLIGHLNLIQSQVLKKIGDLGHWKVPTYKHEKPPDPPPNFGAPSVMGSSTEPVAPGPSGVVSSPRSAGSTAAKPGALEARRNQRRHY